MFACIETMEGSKKKGTSRFVTDVTFLLSFLHGRREEDIRHDIAGLLGAEASEGWEITFAKSSGWSHRKEDKTKGHSEP